MWKELSRYQERIWQDAQDNIRRASKWWDLWLQPPRVEVGTTPKEIVYRENKARLFHYRAEVNEVKPLPILVVYALINRLYILDLLGKRSFVRHLLGEGLDVYAVDWGTPGEDFVVLAYGRDFGDVSPLRGVLQGGATTTPEVAVQLTPAAEPTTA